MGAEKVTKIGVGSKAWANSVRKKAKELSKALDNGYMEMSKLLWTVHKVPVDGDANKGSIYTSWGYATFGEYVEEELGIHRRKAERLRNIGEMFDVQLADVDEALKTRLSKVGWSKLRELRRVFQHKSDPKTVLKWTERAEQSNYPAFLNAVGKFLDAIDTFADGSTTAKPTKTKSEKGKPGKKVMLDDEEVELPDMDRTHTYHFLCFNEQIDNVREALERAEELIDAKGNDGSSKSKSALLSLICMDFLATNDFGKKMDPKTRAKFLAKLETHMGVKLVAIEKGEIVHGKAIFAKTVKAMAED